jgi:hypothetical protein
MEPGSARQAPPWSFIPENEGDVKFYLGFYRGIY